MARSGIENAARLTRERVLNAALEIADTEGLASLTMRRLAAGLDVGVMSLYRYVETKQDLLDGVVHVALEPLTKLQTSGATWDSQLSSTILRLYAALRAHPGATQALADGFIPGAALDPVRDELLGILLKAGFTRAQSVAYLHTLFTYTIGFAVVAGRQGAPGKSEAERLHSLLPAEFAYLSTVSDEFGKRFGQNSFETGLDAILEGFRTVLDR